MRWLARSAFRTILCAGWMALALVIALFTLEKSGVLARVVRDILADRLGSLGADLRVRDAQLRWFQLALDVEGIEVGDSIRIDAARIDLRLLGNPHVARCELHGGIVRISPALVNGLAPRSSGLEQKDVFARREEPLPVFRVEDLRIELATRRWGRLPIGRLDALLRGDDKNQPELWGRMVPSLAANVAASGEVFVHGKVREPGQFEVSATATHLPIGTDYMPPDRDLDLVRAIEPRGLLELDAHGLFGLDGKTTPHARGRISIQDASFVVPDTKERFSGVKVEVDTAWDPKSAAEWVDPHAWQVDARIEGHCEEGPFEWTGLFGADAGPGLLAKSWVHAPRLVLSHALLDLAGDPPEAVRQWSAYDPRGACETWLALRLPAESVPNDTLPDTPSGQPAERLLDKLEIGVQARFAGASGMTYHGLPDGPSGAFDMGFPLPLEKITGDAVFAFDPLRLRRWRLGLFDLAGDDGAGIIRAAGVVEAHPVDVPPFWPGYGSAEIDLALSTEGLAIDERLEHALAGLSRSLPPATTWEPYHPSGGNLDVDLKLFRTADMEYAGIDLALRLSKVSLAWNDLPVPVSQASGRLQFRSDGRSDHGLAFAFDGQLRTAQRLHVGARFQTDAGAPAPPDGKDLDQLTVIAMDVDHVSLTGDDKKILVTARKDLLGAMDAAAPKGFADVHYERLRAAADAPFERFAEVTPRGPVQLTPQHFQMITSDVRGRVLVSAREGERVGANGVREPFSDTRVRIAPLVGTWGQNVQVGFDARFPEGRLRIFGAGIDPSSKSLLGSLRAAVQDESGPAAAVDVSALSLEGQFDFTSEIQLADESHVKPMSSHRFYLRDNALETAEGFRLDGLQGVLVMKDGVLYGERLDALLAHTPVELRETQFQSGPEGFELHSRFEAKDLAIDREHLAKFIDAKTLDAVFEELRWKGSVDVADGRIKLSGPAHGKTRLELAGRITPHDMSVQLGLPITIASASATIERLIYEGGRVRALVRIEDLHGKIADRELGPANLLVTYVEPNLSIESLSGRLEGGEILPLGGDAGRGGTVMSIGLEAPYAFQLALGLRQVEVGGLVHGLFPSNIASRGRLDAELRLTGDMNHLLGINGSGSVKIVDSRLWSVPVFRALFSQLGLESTTVFDSMATNLMVRSGKIDMRDITVRSPLLQLVGKGSLDFDGALSYDLEVRYDLVDRLGPFTRLLYFIQNKLLSVMIRGDMARPEVIFKNFFTGMFGSQSDRPRPLPLPPWAPLPPRF